MPARKRNSKGNSRLSNNKPYMENIKQWSGVLVAIVAIVVFGFFQKPAQVIVNIPEQTVNTPPLGALTGPDIPYSYFSFGGVRRFAGSRTLNQASTTICSIQSPVSTSTLVLGSVKITTGTTTAIGLEIGKSTLFDATTTRLSYVELASGAQVSLTAFVASTTGAYGALARRDTADPSDMVFAPSQNMNVKYGGAAGSLNTLVG